MIDKLYNYLFIGLIVVLGVLILLTIIKSIIGPRLTDRIVSVNMVGTSVVSCIVLLTLYLDHSYILDMSLIYVIISFIAVVVLTNVFVNKYEENKEKDGDQ